MIRPSESGATVYVCTEPVDFRKQSAGLAALVQAQLELNPFEAALFVFTNRRRNAVRILTWERNGFVLWSKKLERERFDWRFTRSADEATVPLTVQELNWLLDGFDLRHWRPHTTLEYRYAA